MWSFRALGIVLSTYQIVQMCHNSLTSCLQRVAGAKKKQLYLLFIFSILSTLHIRHGSEQLFRSNITRHMILFCRYSSDVPFDHQFTFKQSSPTTPVLIVYTKEKDAGERVLAEFARKKQQSYKSVMLSGSGPGEERQARKIIQESMTDVSFSRIDKLLNIYARPDNSVG